MSVKHDFIKGLSFWVRGWRHLLSQRSLLILTILPFTISIGTTWLLIYLLWTYLPGGVTSLLGFWEGSPGWWQDMLYYPLLVSGALLILFASVYVIYLLQTLVAVPFHSLLADRTLAQLGKKLSGPTDLKAWLSESLRMLRIGLIKTGVFLLLGIILFIFSFVPFLNLIAFGTAFLLLAFDCLDYSFEALGFDLRERVVYVFKHWAEWLGMGIALALTLIIPGLTLLIIPGAVVGAAFIIHPERVKPS